MNNVIDIRFNVYSDTPPGKDPDSFSLTLRQYHKLLWSKPLPNGVFFNLNDKKPMLLHHQSDLGEFFLSSDSIGHTYGGSGIGYVVKSMVHILNQIPPDELKDFFEASSTIGAFIIFPSKRINNKMTINGERGFNSKIKDRFDLTLECIRRHYENESSPLGSVLHRYSSFFNLFKSFQGYVDFFLLQDLVEENYSSIKFFLPFNNFKQSPLPHSVDEYLIYKENVLRFIKARNHKIKSTMSFY